MAEKEPTTQAGILAIQGVTAPEVIEREMIERVRAEVIAEREARGAVSLLADTFPLQRKLLGASDYLTRYERAVKAVRKELDSTIEEEAADGGNSASEQPMTAKAWNGTAVPAANVKVPDPEGDWKIERQFERDVSVDWQQVLMPGVMAVLAKTVAENSGDVDVADLEEDDWEYIGLLGGAVLDRILADLALVASALTPKTTGLAALSERYSREGDDKSASVVTSAVKKVSRYKGIKASRA